MEARVQDGRSRSYFGGLLGVDPTTLGLIERCETHQCTPLNLRYARELGVPWSLYLECLP